MNSEDNTKILPKINEEDYSLDLYNVQNKRKNNLPRKKNNKNFWRIFFVVLVFAIGLFLGFKAVDTYDVTTQKNYNEKMHKVEELDRRQKQLDADEIRLKNKEQELNQKIKQLEEEKSHLEEDKSIVQLIVDEISGKNEEEKIKKDNLKAEINSLKENLSDLNEGFDKLKALKDKTTKLQIAAKEDLNHYESTLDGFIYKLKLFINNILN